MPARALRRQILLSTTMIVGALTGYGGRVYAQGCTGSGGVYTCSGAATTTQTINVNNATVSTTAPFSVNVNAPATNAISIYGDGALSYFDDNYSPLTSGDEDALFISAISDIPAGALASVIVTVNGTLTGANYGIQAHNSGSGETKITANGDVTGTSKAGIFGDIDGSSYLDITTAAGTLVSGSVGIRAIDQGSGMSTITANGNVTGTGAAAISSVGGSDSDDVTITTGPGATILGAKQGILAINIGHGALSVTTGGDVTGTDEEGIYATSNFGGITGGTDLSVTTGAGTTVMGYTYGIRAINGGSGETMITVNGDVTGTDRAGVLAVNTASATNLSITTAAGTTVSGGIGAANAGSGTTEITANGTVTGSTAIFAQITGDGGVSITAGTGATIQGVKSGIFSRNFGTGTTRITANGNVTGAYRDAIYAYGGSAITINVSSAATVTSNATDPNFAVYSIGAPTSLTVAGTLNGGAGGAVQFDQTNAYDNRLELQPTATITGNVFAGPGTNDTLAFGGTGQGTFDLSKIDTGAGTKQYQNFEVFDVDSGTWSFSGATTMPFTVNGGTLKGTGTFGGLTVNGGTVAPGNSIGTMYVNGAFTLGSGAVYEVEANAQGQSDKVVVKGTVNLTGSVLHVLAANGNYNTKTNYTIIDNDGTDAVVGAFSSITSSLAFLTPTVVYNGGTGNDVVLTLARTSTDFCSVAKTRNQCNVATVLDQFSTDNALYLAVLNQTAAGARQAFDALSGEIHATVAGVLADDSRYVRDAILGRLVQATYTNNAGERTALGEGGPQVASLDSQAMALGYSDKSLSAPAPSPLAFWTRAYGAWGDFNGDGNAATANRNLGGFVSGMDTQVFGSWRAGLATGASFSNVNVDARYSSAQVDSYHLGGYLGGMAGALALRGGGMWAWSDIDTSRAVVFPGFYERQKASYNADTGQLFGEAAYPTQAWGMALEPFAGLAYVSETSDTFHEHGGALARLRGIADQDVSYTTVGLRAAQTMTWGAMLVTPHISAAWQHAFDDVTPDAALAFATTGIGFTVYGVPLAEDAALLDTGLDLTLGPNTTAGVSYSGQYGDHVIDNAVKGRFTWLF